MPASERRKRIEKGDGQGCPKLAPGPNRTGSKVWWWGSISQTRSAADFQAPVASHSRRLVYQPRGFPRVFI